MLFLVTLFSVLVISDNLTDFLRGFKILINSEPYTNKELKLSKNALTLATKLVTLSAIFGTITGIVNLLSSLDDPSAIGPALAVALLYYFPGNLIVG